MSLTYTATAKALLTLLNAAESYPCVNTSSGKYIPTKSSVCPCTLFVDIAKHGLNGNWHHLKVNGSSVFDGAIVMYGIKIFMPLLTPLATFTSNTLSQSFEIIIYVPFLNPFPGPPLRFLSKITGAPTLSVIE